MALPKPFSLAETVDPGLTAEKYQVTPEQVVQAIKAVENDKLYEPAVSAEQIELSQTRRGADLDGYLRAVFDRLAQENGYATYDEYAARVLLNIISLWDKDRRNAVAAIREVNRLLYPEQIQEVKKTLTNEERSRLMERLARVLPATIKAPDLT